MKRRGFFSLVLGALCAPFLPKPKVPRLMFHKDAFHLAVVPLELPSGAAMAARVNEDGLSVRVISDYNITSDVSTFRFDVLYGVTALRPDLAVRISGT